MTDHEQTQIELLHKIEAAKANLRDAELNRDAYKLATADTSYELTEMSKGLYEAIGVSLKKRGHDPENLLFSKMSALLDELRENSADLGQYADEFMAYDDLDY